MKIFVLVILTLVIASCEGLFFGQGSGNVALSGNFHGLGNHPLLSGGNKATEVPVVEESVVTEPAPTIQKSDHGFSLQGQLQGILKNHKILSQFHGNKQAPEEIVEQSTQAVQVPVKSSSHNLLKNHRLLSGASSGFSFQGNILKNHRLLAGLSNKNSAPTETEDPFGGDNTGYSVSTNESENVQSEVNTIPETVEALESSSIDNDAAITGSINGQFSAKSSHNVHKILGDIVGAKVKLLEQTKNQISSRFDSHIKNLDKLKNQFNKNEGSSFGQISVNAETRRY